MKIRYLLLVGLIAVLLLSGCQAQEAGTGDTEPVDSMDVEVSVADENLSPQKIGNVPKEDPDDLQTIICGDGICHNREYMSESKRFECRSLLDSCAVFVNDKKVGTENYFICKKDCAADCDLDFDLDVCEVEEGMYKMVMADNKGNLYNYAFLYRAKNAPFVKYGGGVGEWTLDLRSIADVIGPLQSLEIVPRIMNDDGTIVECTNHEIVLTEIDSC